MQFSLLTLFRGFLTLILVATSIADDCEYCTKITDRFTESLQKTAHKGFSGGNTHWEETNIGSYATSEVRFHDIIDSLCANSDNAWCFGILDTLEPIMHTWWTSVFKRSTTVVLLTTLVRNVTFAPRAPGLGDHVLETVHVPDLDCARATLVTLGIFAINAIL
ncbi:hypothetical protein P879_09714 [Paragonimus westermani]|uniref:Uncharacterized protein n=1 Tax=Paragonimus westermani TaxID=34504 RepID=A0A8T0D928_9TREM|nr:hypothetical protein P879_09714 [Paragonimus westermani]